MYSEICLCLQNLAYICLSLCFLSFAKRFSKNSNFNDSGISLPAFPSRTNLKLHNIHVFSKLVKQVITNLDLSKVSGPDCIPEMVLKKCEPELS